ncbi:MAG: hypothetical protein M1834_001636 [Cirrosporium novae-zelandiae]|nr:MAG: hypothetical protein M1834_004153 [Cirrosporium novae-zelandiae]KAI9735620.1 MAG: hypothetical protein M1834_001636 [Cirrosporium novae-zelandiae]
MVSLGGLINNNALAWTYKEAINGHEENPSKALWTALLSLYFPSSQGFIVTPRLRQGTDITTRPDFVVEKIEDDGVVFTQIILCREKPQVQTESQDLAADSQAVLYGQQALQVAERRGIRQKMVFVFRRPVGVLIKPCRLERDNPTALIPLSNDFLDPKQDAVEMFQVFATIKSAVILDQATPTT